MLQVLEYLPEGILDVDATQLKDLLDRPTLIHLSGKRDQPLFISILLHGNETVGWEAVKLLLKQYGDQPLPRAISLFIGNIAAAEKNVRRLDNQPDFNRIWPGGELTDTPESVIVQMVVDQMRERDTFVSVDVHNNTGKNPHYACINHLDHHSLHLASLFGRIIVYFIRPTGVAAQAMSTICPSVTLECGKVGDLAGLNHAVNYLDACLRMDALPDKPVAEHDVDIYHTIAVVKVKASDSISFDGEAADIVFVEGIEDLNFSELDAGTTLAKSTSSILWVSDEYGKDITEKILSRENGEIKLKKSLMPAMLTLNEAVIRQDCLCYLMERYHI